VKGIALKVLIAGGGVIGMMQARELAQHGLDVVLIDKGVCGAEASWAGGGIISPLYPWRYSEPVSALARWSQAYYPNLIESLEAESDIDPELTRHGLMMLSVKDYDEALVWAKDFQAWLNVIESTDIYQLEPQLRPGFREALWMPQVASVRNPRLLKALRMSLERLPNVEFHEEDGVRELVNQDNSRVCAVTNRGLVFDADRAVVCSGAWTPEILSSLAPRIEPVKGQMILFEAPQGLVNRVVLKDGQYVLPRRDGSVIAGSTLEYKGFDKTPTEKEKEALADMAIDLFPELARCPIRHHWAGLRPGSVDGVPLIGAVPNMSGVYVNAGHFRNGLVLAPASVRLMTSLMLDEAPPVDPQPYDLSKASAQRSSPYPAS